MTLTYLKIAAAVALAALLFGGGWYCGGLKPTAALQADHAAMAQATTQALLAQRAQLTARTVTDHTAETTHAQDLAEIDALTPIATPVIVYRGTAPVCGSAVPGAPAQASGQPAGPAGGGSQPVGGGRDIRPDIEALKKRLERVMADYRQLDAEWPK